MLALKAEVENLKWGAAQRSAQVASLLPRPGLGSRDVILPASAPNGSFTTIFITFSSIVAPLVPHQCLRQASRHRWSPQPASSFLLRKAAANPMWVCSFWTWLLEQQEFRRVQAALWHVFQAAGFVDLALLTTPNASQLATALTTAEAQVL